MTVNRRQGWLRRLRALLTRLAWPAGRTSTFVRAGSTLTIRPDSRLFLLDFPLLPWPFAELLDFDALERAAGQVRREATEPPQRRRPPKGLREYLKKGVTRTEALILTAELSRIGSCRAVRPGRSAQCCREGASPAVRLLLTDKGLEVFHA